MELAVKIKVVKMKSMPKNGSTWKIKELTKGLLTNLKEKQSFEHLFGQVQAETGRWKIPVNGIFSLIFKTITFTDIICVLILMLKLPQGSNTKASNFHKSSNGSAKNQNGDESQFELGK